MECFGYEYLLKVIFQYLVIKWNFKNTMSVSVCACVILDEIKFCILEFSKIIFSWVLYLKKAM